MPGPRHQPCIPRIAEQREQVQKRLTRARAQPDRAWFICAAARGVVSCNLLAGTEETEGLRLVTGAGRVDETGEERRRMPQTDRGRIGDGEIDDAPAGGATTRERAGQRVRRELPLGAPGEHGARA